MTEDKNQHDPLCDNQPEYFDGSILWPERCTCDLIAKVRADEREKFIAVERFMTERGEASIPKHIVEFIRADEREKAAQRVESCVNKFKARDFNDAVDACAAAVRGES